MTVGALGEREIIRRLSARFPASGGTHRMIRDIGDDASVVAFSGDDHLAVTSDALIESVHFRREWMPSNCLGHKSLAVSLSDLAAMGARPELFLLDLGLPHDWPLAELDAFADGMATLANHHDIRLAGGDTVASPRLHVGVTAVGSVAPGRETPRSGGRPGDRLALVGTLGASATGLRLLESGWRLDDGGRARPPEVGSAIPAEVAAPLLAAHLRPLPRVREGRDLAGVVTASIDVSDGLAHDLHNLVAASSCGAVVDMDALPVSPETRRACEAMDRDPLADALAGGEDYALLVALSGADLPDSVEATVIGRLSRRETGVRLVRGGREEPLPRHGHEHFRAP